MPELPDVTVYIEALESRVRGKRLDRVKLLNPFILRTAVPPISQAEGKRVGAIRRVGKRIVLELEGPLYLVLHLMIAGRLRWLQGKDKAPGRITLALL
ncbi:MAG TPA: DNA-formamidopyrimidine glycosylase family protein, partial [Burkholderiales bacterium]|nr:DNA-formamidopyrimidine glycosylase family protein [Burkholderiales bacterium]